ncbi:TPA: retron Ec78 anti-phage system effector ATPase PtuA [Serratia fonticola]|jgi:predicted ATP-binding protein involved in virulence
MANNKFFKITRTAAEKLTGAEKGHLGDQFEVSEWYSTGRYSVDKDEEKSQRLLKNVEENLCSKRPYFTNLDIANFKGIRKFRNRIRLDPHLNVFVGINGSGKTTILEALVRVSSWIVNGIRTQGQGKHIDLIEINNSSDVRECAISATLSLDDESDFSIKLYKNLNSNSRTRSELTAFRNLSAMYQYVNSENSEASPLPIFAYYSVGRSQEIKKEEYDKAELTTFNKLDGYHKSFDESGNFKDLTDWLIIHNAESSSEINSSIIRFNELQAVHENTKRMFSLLSDDLKDESDIGRSLTSDLKEQKEEIIELENKLKNSDTEVVRIVKYAISCFLDISNIRLEITSESVRIMLDKNGISIPATALSQGEKALFSLISDISRRMVLLNPNKGKDALKGNGVIFIDELELHLHPKWQQQVIFKLKDVFPNIQFILTTHSPQVLTTVPHYCIKVLEGDTQGTISITEPDFSLGAESNLLLEEIFLVSSRPEDAEEVRILERYKELVRNDKWDSEEAMQLLPEIEKWGRNYDPVVRQLQMDVRLRQYRRGSKQ